ncbi:MAG: hypothetical protein ACREKN_01245 [Longimicrobiaceae bacterium]
MLALLLAAELAAAGAYPPLADTAEVRTGGYLGSMYGTPITRERFEWRGNSLLACVDYQAVGALLRVSLHRDESGRLERYAVTLDFLDQGPRRFEVRAVAGAVIWSSEEGGVWRERRLAVDPERPLIIFQSAVFSLYGQFAGFAVARGGDPVSVQGVYLEEGVIEEWTVERKGKELVVRSPGGVESRFPADGAVPPRTVSIPAQGVTARPDREEGVPPIPLCSPPGRVLGPGGVSAAAEP